MNIEYKDVGHTIFYERTAEDGGILKSAWESWKPQQITSCKKCGLKYLTPQSFTHQMTSCKTQMLVFLKMSAQALLKHISCKCKKGCWAEVAPVWFVRGRHDPAQRRRPTTISGLCIRRSRACQKIEIGIIAYIPTSKIQIVAYCCKIELWMK